MAGRVESRSLLAWSGRHGLGSIAASCQAILEYTPWKSNDPSWAQLKGGGSTSGTTGLISSCHLRGNSQNVCEQLHPWRVGVGGGGIRRLGQEPCILGWERPGP